MACIYDTNINPIPSPPSSMTPAAVAEAMVSLFTACRAKLS